MRQKRQKIYNYIFNQADKVVYISTYYYKRCMHTRNRYLVNNSGVCICYLTNSKGNTEYTANCAKQKGLKIISLAQS